MLHPSENTNPQQRRKLGPVSPTKLDQSPDLTASLDQTQAISKTLESPKGC